MSKLRLTLLLVGGPILLLVLLDRAFVSYRPHWEWVVREVPPNQVDSYRVEALLRTTPPDPANVVILGDSTALASLDAPMLDAAFADQGRHFVAITLGGTQTLAFGFLANSILGLEPGAVVLVVSPYSTRSEIDFKRVHMYDARAVPSLFTLGEVLAHPYFHFQGLAAQSHVLIRHRWVLRQSLQVWLGQTNWQRIEMENMRDRLRRLRNLRRGDLGPILDWFRARVPEIYPNPNTRAIGYLARRMRERGGTLVLMESPAHPLVSMVTPPARLGPFREQMRAITRREGILYITADDLPQLTNEDFADQSHLNEQGRRTVTEVVARRLHEVL